MISCHECPDMKTCPDNHAPKYPSTVSTLGCLKDEDEQNPQAGREAVSAELALLYLIKIEQDEDGQFVATSDKLPYVSAHGHSPQDALKEYCDALGGVLEVMEEDSEILKI